MGNLIQIIRKLHDNYICKRAEFDDNNGIISPIRACLFENNEKLVKFLMAYANMNDTEKKKYFRSKSTQIGYFVACKDKKSNKIKTAWSLCAGPDIGHGLFDREYGLYLAINRLLSNSNHYTIDSIYKTHRAYTLVTHNEYPIQFFGDEAIIEQAEAFAKRCKKYYKGCEE